MAGITYLKFRFNSGWFLKHIELNPFTKLTEEDGNMTGYLSL